MCVRHMSQHFWLYSASIVLYIALWKHFMYIIPENRCITVDHLVWLLSKQNFYMHATSFWVFVFVRVVCMLCVDNRH